MSTFITGCIILFITICCHVALHRLLVLMGRRTFSTAAIYAVGLVIYALLLTVWAMPLALSALMVYGLITVLFLLFFASYFYEGNSPTAQIISIIRQQGRMSKDAILRQFQNDSVIFPRLSRLVSGGFVIEKNRRFIATSKGRAVARLLNAYRKVLRWDKGGG